MIGQSKANVLTESKPWHIAVRDAFISGGIVLFTRLGTASWQEVCENTGQIAWQAVIGFCLGFFISLAWSYKVRYEVRSE